jgi:four helix bundle suffix protein
VLTATKMNLAECPDPRVFRTVDGAVTWVGDEPWLTPDDVTGAAPGSAAAGWLELVLARGPKPAAEVKAEAAATGISERTLWRAKRMLAVVSRRYYDIWFWCKPGDDPANRFGGLSPVCTFDERCQSEVEAGPTPEPRDPQDTPAEQMQWAKRVLRKAGKQLTGDGGNGTTETPGTLGRLSPMSPIPRNPPMETPGFIPPHGQYQKLLSYQKAEVIYDLTFHLCHRFLSKGDRTIDQMIQAARSGKQNIAEGSAAAGTSKEMEIKLTNVARASLEELLNDYRDFLRVRNLPLWDKNSKQAKFVRDKSRSEELSYETFREFCETSPPEVAANIAICLIHQARYLLDRQLGRLEQDFVREGGLRERMTRVRLQQRSGKR